MIEAGILASCRPRAGGTGNGKSTLLAAMTRAMREDDPDSDRPILEYSTPLEFVFDEINSSSTPSGN